MNWEKYPHTLGNLWGLVSQIWELCGFSTFSTFSSPPQLKDANVSSFPYNIPCNIHCNIHNIICNVYCNIYSKSKAFEKYSVWENIFEKVTAQFF